MMKSHPSPSPSIIIAICIAFLLINLSEIEAQKYPRGPFWTEAKVITPCPSISCGDAYSISDIRCVMEVAQLQDVTVDDAKCIAAGLGRRDLMRKQICPVHPSCQTCKDYKTSQSGLCIDQSFCKATKRKVIPGLCGAGGRVCCVGEGKTPEEQIKTPIPCKNPAGAAGTCMKMQSCTKAKGSSFPGCQGFSVCCVSRTSEIKQGISNTLTKIKDKVTGFFSKPTPPTTNSGIIISDTSKSAAGRVAGTNLLQQQEQEQEQAQLRHN